MLALRDTHLQPLSLTGHCLLCSPSRERSWNKNTNHRGRAEGLHPLDLEMRKLKPGKAKQTSPRCTAKSGEARPEVQALTLHPSPGPFLFYTSKIDPISEFIYLKPWSTNSNVIPNIILVGKKINFLQTSLYYCFPKGKKNFLCVYVCLCMCLFFGPQATETVLKLQIIIIFWPSFKKKSIF